MRCLTSSCSASSPGVRTSSGTARACACSRTQIPPAGLIHCVRPRPLPHFLGGDDIERLLQAALELAPDGGLRRWTFHCLFVLLSVSGLRIGETRALTFADVDLQEAILTIRSTKFGKSRLVSVARQRGFQVDQQAADRQFVALGARHGGVEGHGVVSDRERLRSKRSE
jgi:integrase